MFILPTFHCQKSAIDLRFIQEFVKYSGRVAEGIRGNSRERSSLEFDVMQVLFGKR
jgi:hypothetical protein